MQTFLPYPDFTASARALDNKRLNEQIIEAAQIARVIMGQSDGWANHPCVDM
jgi:hypothetical protein